MAGRQADIVCMYVPVCMYVCMHGMHAFVYLCMYACMFVVCKMSCPCNCSCFLRKAAWLDGAHTKKGWGCIVVICTEMSRRVCPLHALVKHCLSVSAYPYAHLFFSMCLSSLPIVCMCFADPGPQ